MPLLRRDIILTVCVITVAVWSVVIAFLQFHNGALLLEHSEQVAYFRRELHEFDRWKVTTSGNRYTNADATRDRADYHRRFEEIERRIKELEGAARIKP